MQINFRNYVIQPDYGSTWMLQEKLVRGKDSEKEGKEYMSEPIFPKSLQRCFEVITERERKNLKVVGEAREIIANIAKQDEELVQ